jgi:predicted GNAT family acetyltransferase
LRDPDGQSEVVDRRDEGRLTVQEGDSVAELVYEIEDGRMVLVHTGVPQEMGHRGVAGRLVAYALDVARRENMTLVPLCPYARKWMREHPRAVEGLQVDWGEAHR